MKKIHFSTANHPDQWWADDYGGVIKFASEVDAKAAERLFNDITARAEGGDRNAALEEAARICEAKCGGLIADEGNGGVSHDECAKECAYAIRELLRPMNPNRSTDAAPSQGEKK